jgi:hypothetical protein
MTCIGECITFTEAGYRIFGKKRKTDQFEKGDQKSISKKIRFFFSNNDLTPKTRSHNYCTTGKGKGFVWIMPCGWITIREPT